MARDEKSERHQSYDKSFCFHWPPPTLETGSRNFISPLLFWDGVGADRVPVEDVLSHLKHDDEHFTLQFIFKLISRRTQRHVFSVCESNM